LEQKCNRKSQCSIGKRNQAGRKRSQFQFFFNSSEQSKKKGAKKPIAIKVKMESPPKTTIDYAEWPRDAPSALERNVITIICGNTRLHWALHEGCINKFIPILFWYTMHDSDSNVEEDEFGDPCDMLEAHIAGQAHALIFGEPFGNKGNTKSISQTTAMRDAPGISVFVVSSNPRQEHKICHMFRDVPAKLFKLRNTDFFNAEQGVYRTMGVDRCAALYGAKSHYGAPALVIDGGTAMTYTMLDADGVIQGGGISPGVKVRLQSLADYTGSLPTIDHNTFKTAVEGAMEAKTPLSFFAKDTQTAMIAPVCAELSCQLRNIIKQYISKCQSFQVVENPAISSTSSLISAEGEETAENAFKQPTTKRYPVVITGGDGKFIYDLLQPDASSIVSIEPDAAPIRNHSIDVKHIKNIVTYGLGALIYEKYSQKKNDPQEKLRLKIQGLRIAAPAIDQKELFSRGCVFNITPKARIEGYIFHARFDNGIRKDLTLIELYDALVLYNEIGELPDGIAALEVGTDWMIEKKMWSKKVQEELGNVSRLIRNRIRQLKPHMEKGEIAEIFQKWSSIESRRNSPGKNTKKQKLSDTNPRDVVGKRLAKRFPIDIGGAVGDQIFFGTVQYISHSRHKWFFVSYDDGDSEDLGMEEVMEGIGLYELHKFSDPIHKDNVENSNVIDVDEQESLEQDSSKPAFGNALHNTAEDDGATTYTDLSTLLGLSASATDIHANERRISEFKEDI